MVRIKKKKFHYADKHPLVLSLAAAARVYGIDSGTLREAIDRGDLRASRPTARTIRILRADMEEWFNDFIIRKAIESVGKPAKAKDAVVRSRLERERRAKRR